jgi:hypothetical protein
MYNFYRGKKYLKLSIAVLRIFMYCGKRSAPNEDFQAESFEFFHANDYDLHCIAVMA